ncbi:hypothetical protein GCM10023191_052170 [Actinoallomurus oryzae]|jgi:hypothetical protein|uniref:Excreted virulence factor EspC, type VII ESX diderm n=1 Tax=Actinoallomurus oryzae TaxID=502180 RepID=A0ABP8QGK8_9ACTN
MTENTDLNRYVNYGKLLTAAEGAANTAHGLRKHTDDLVDGCVSAAAGHEAFDWHGKLLELHAAWHQHVHGHATDIHGYYDRLVETHHNSKRGQHGAEADVNRLRGLTPRQEI